MDARKKVQFAATLQPMRWLLLVLLVLFDPPWAWAGSRFHERNHTGLLALYGFDDGQRSETLQPTTARDYTGRGLLGELDTSPTTLTWTANRIGFTSQSASGGVRAVSQKNTTRLLGLLGSEFSIELFFSSPTTLGGPVLIAGFGDWPAGASFPACESTAPTVDGGWKMFATLGNGVNFQTAIAADGVPTCYEFSHGFTPGVLRHTVFRGRQGQVGVASQGSYDDAQDPTVSFDVSLWARHYAPLSLIVPQRSEAWQGAIFMIAVYDRFLSDAEVSEKQVQGPPNSLSVTSCTALGISEDVTTILYP